MLKEEENPTAATVQYSSCNAPPLTDQIPIIWSPVLSPGCLNQPPIKQLLHAFINWMVWLISAEILRTLLLLCLVFQRMHKATRSIIADLSYKVLDCHWCRLIDRTNHQLTRTVKLIWNKKECHRKHLKMRIINWVLKYLEITMSKIMSLFSRTCPF